MAREEALLTYLRSLYGAADAAIREALDALIAEAEEAQAGGEILTVGWWESAARYRDLQQQVQARLAELAPDLAEGVAATQAEAAAAGELDAEALAVAAVGEAPGDAVSLTWNRLPVGALDALAGFMADGTTLEAHFATIGPDLAAAIREALFVGVAQGAALDEIGRRLAARTGVARARAETIARTEALRAHREAARLSFMANPEVCAGYVRLSAADGRVCAACWALHGAEYASDEVMPSHPNCRCVMVPKTRTWAEILGEEAAEAGDLAAPGWTVADLPSADELFGRLSAAKKRKVLGATGYEMWKAGAPLAAFGIVEQDERWGPTARVATIAEVVAETGLEAPIFGDE